MNLKFDVKMTAKDLYKYNLRNAYTGMQGILSILFAILVIFVFIWKFDALTLVYKLLFIALAVAFLVYIPICDVAGRSQKDLLVFLACRHMALQALFAGVSEA